MKRFKVFRLEIKKGRHGNDKWWGTVYQGSDYKEAVRYLCNSIVYHPHRQYRLVTVPCLKLAEDISDE